MKNGTKEGQLQTENLLSSQRVVFRTILILFLNNTNALCQKSNRYVIYIYLVFKGLICILLRRFAESRNVRNIRKIHKEFGWKILRAETHSGDFAVCRDNITINLKEAGCKKMHWFHQLRIQTSDRFHKYADNTFTS